jgi:hypothetical protein
MLDTTPRPPVLGTPTRTPKRRRQRRTERRHLVLEALGMAGKVPVPNSPERTDVRTVGARATLATAD